MLGFFLTVRVPPRSTLTDPLLPSATLFRSKVIPAHPVAGTENSGPEAGFASLFQGRWCIVTPPADADPAAVERVAELWRRVGADVETMDDRKSTRLNSSH